MLRVFLLTLWDSYYTSQMSFEDDYNQNEDSEPRKIHIVITNKHLKLAGATATFLIGSIITLVNMKSDIQTAMMGAGLAIASVGMLLKTGLVDD